MFRKWGQWYFSNLYQRTMKQAYESAISSVCSTLEDGGRVLDCGAGTGGIFQTLDQHIGLGKERYCGLEWNPPLVSAAQKQGLNVQRADLNQPLTVADGTIRCVLALSVLEHLLFPCRFLLEARRVLEPGGTLVLLTPNISTLFTAALILAGKMPSSGPHPDSETLLKSEEVFKVSDKQLISDAESEIPSHRHLIVFSYRVLRRYLTMLGFHDIRGKAFGLYPFPKFVQPVMERLDPWHCHQMVFVVKK